MIFTIGHSTHAIETFLSLLAAHSIEAVADVRSAPFSRRNPQFSRGRLERSLREASVAYHLFGRELGARSEDASCYEEGKVQYERLARTDLFRDGLHRLEKLAAERRTAILCAESEPLQCHRTILVSRHLATRGAAIVHIHADARLETHGDAVVRLIRQLRLPCEDMFRTREDVVAEAYRMQGDRIAYTRAVGQNGMMGA